jgi:mono/diheme cytochrome c family protein
MKTMRAVLLIAAVCGLVFSVAYAGGDVAKGKALFNDTNFAGATSGKSCNTCHPDGRGLENAGDKKEFRIMGKVQHSLEEAVNMCIVKAIGGKAIDPASEEMKDIVAYIRSLKG